MSTYKVIQDIEAEDKLLGPFTLRQFIYSAVVIVSLFIGYKIVAATGGKWYLAIPLLPHIVFFGVLAAPFGHDQSTEVWMLAKIRFFFKPRKRIWDQSGVIELVTITVPKKIEKQLTKGFSNQEVQSRLTALANTIDSRGWAIKNVNTNLFQQPAYSNSMDSDRLVNTDDMPREVPSEEAAASFDMMDVTESPTAQHINELMSTSAKFHRTQISSIMKQKVIQPLADPGLEGDTEWFTASPPATPEPRTGTNPPTTAQQTQMSAPQAVSPVTPTLDPAIINLATNDDLNVATIARQADKEREQDNGGEVVVSLR